LSNPKSKRDTLAQEGRAIAELDFALKNADGGNPISIKCGRHRIYDAISCCKLPNNVKADFAICNQDNQPVFWITHKARGFCYNGYGSLGKKLYRHGNQSPLQNEEIWSYVSWAIRYCQNEKMLHKEDRAGNGKTIQHWRWSDPSRIRGVYSHPPAQIKSILVYGRDFGSPDYGEFNCHISGIGSPILSPQKGQIFELTFLDGISHNYGTDQNGMPIGILHGGDDEPLIGISDNWRSKKGTIWLREDQQEGVDGWICAMPMRAIQFGNRKENKWSRIIKVDYPMSKKY
jgi:hypothetical protein